MRLTKAQAVALFGKKVIPPENKSKYRNVKCVWKGQQFDSIRERDRFIILENELREGRITDLNRQVRLQLLPAQKDENGKVIEKPCFYIADFTYRRDGKLVVEDVKGVKTSVYLLKRKMCLWFHGIRIQEV